MGKANFYYYFSSKKNLLYQIHLDNLKRNFIPILEEAEQLPDPEDWIVLFLRKFTLMNTSDQAGRVFVHEIGSLSKSHQNGILLIWRSAYEILRVAIRELQQTGNREGTKIQRIFSDFPGGLACYFR